jgi:hypothetical protein
MESFIIPVVSFIVTLIPIFSLVWNMSKMSSQVKTNSNDLDHLGTKVRELEKQVQGIMSDHNITNITIIERLTRIETKLDALETQR